MRYCYWILTALILSSCHSHQKWQLEYIKASQFSYNSKRVVLASNHPLEPEIIITKASSETLAYLYFLSYPISSNEKEHSIEIYLKQDGNNYAIKGNLFAGGQCILIEKSDTDTLLSLLHNPEPLHLTIQGYQKTVYPSNFSKALKKI